MSAPRDIVSAISRFLSVTSIGAIAHCLFSRPAVESMNEYEPGARFRTRNSFPHGTGILKIEPASFIGVAEKVHFSPSAQSPGPTNRCAR